MNSSDRSLEDGPSVVTKVFPYISPAISPGSMIEDHSVEVGDCEDYSKRSTCNK